VIVLVTLVANRQHDNFDLTEKAAGLQRQVRRGCSLGEPHDVAAILFASQLSLRISKAKTPMLTRDSFIDRQPVVTEMIQLHQSCAAADLGRVARQAS
jgi:hypothetical protein